MYFAIIKISIIFTFKPDKSMKKILGLSVFAMLCMSGLVSADNLWSVHVRNTDRANLPTGYADYIVNHSYGSSTQQALNNVENFFNMNSRVSNSETIKTCEYTPSSNMTLYGGSTGASCEPKFVTYSKYGTPNPYLIVGEGGKGYTYTTKTPPNDAEFRNNVGMAGEVFTPAGATKPTLAFIPVVDSSEPWINNTYNNYGTAAVTKPEYYSTFSGIADDIKTQKTIKYDINPSAELNDITEFKQGIARRVLSARLLLRERVTQGGGNYSLYRFPKDAKFQTEGVDNYIFGTPWSGKCQKKFNNGLVYGTWPDCQSYSTRANHKSKPFRISFYADVIPELSQINKGVYLRPNKLVGTYNTSQTNFGLQGFAGKNDMIRFAVIPRDVVMYKVWGEVDNIDFSDLRTNFRPNIVYHLNYVAFVGKQSSVNGKAFDGTNYLPCGWKNGKPSMCNHHAVGSDTARSRDAVAIDKSLATKKQDLNGYTSGQYYQGVGYRLKGSAVGQDSQMNSVFYSNGGQFPYQADNRYAYFLDIGFCGDGLIQTNFGEKCDWPNCSKDCQKFEENKCGNGTIDKIGEYINSTGSKVPVYEQCDYKMFVNDELNQAINATGANGKYDGFNNPCYAPEEKEIAKKYGRTQCQWKVPEATIKVIRDEEKKDGLPKEVIVENYPAWATTKDIRIFKYLFKKDGTGTEADIKAESTKIKAMPYAQKVAYLAGKNNPNMLHQSLLSDTFNDKLCAVLNKNEGSANKLCSSPLIQPKDGAFNCSWFYGMVNPKYTAPFYTMLPTSGQKLDTWSASTAGIITKKLLPIGFSAVIQQATKSNTPFNFYKLGNDLNEIGVGITKSNITDSMKLLKNNEGHFTTWQCSREEHSDSVKLRNQYYVHLSSPKEINDAMPASMSQAEKDKHTIRPIYGAMLYNNVALAYGFQVHNVTTELDELVPIIASAPKCSEKDTKIRDKGNGVKEIDFSKAFDKHKTDQRLKDGAVCMWVKEENRPEVSLGNGNINLTLTTPTGERLNLKCVKGDVYLKNADSMKFNFQRHKKNGSAHITFATLNITTGQYEASGTQMCIASLDGGISVEKCDVANFHKGDEKPNSTPLQGGNIGNLIGVNAF